MKIVQKMFPEKQITLQTKSYAPSFMHTEFKAGDKVPTTGIYNEVTANKHIVKRIACIKGERFPTNDLLSCNYELIRAAINK